MDEGPTHDPKAYRHHTMDNAALGGCLIFSAASVGQLAACFVPFAIAERLLTAQDLRSVILWCAVWSIVLGLAATLGFGLPGFLGTLGGLIPASLFVHLRLRHALMGVPGIEGMEPASFPPSSAWSAPLLIALSCIAICGAMYAVRSR